MRANAWQKLWGEHLRNNGSGLGATDPLMHRSELVSEFCHGDDFVTAATEDQNEMENCCKGETDRHDRCSRTLG